MGQHNNGFWLFFSLKDFRRKVTTFVVPIIVLQLNVDSKHIKSISINSYYLVTFRLQEARDTKAVVSYPEGILQILSGAPQQGLPHVHQAGVNGLDDSQEGQTTCPALPKVLNCNTISMT